MTPKQGVESGTMGQHMRLVRVEEGVAGRHGPGKIIFLFNFYRGIEEQWFELGRGDLYLTSQEQRAEEWRWEVKRPSQ